MSLATCLTSLRRPHFIVLTTLLLAFTGLGASTMAQAAPSAAGYDDIECGSVITTDVTLTHDLADCRNNGLVVGADGITIDLGGHSIDGNARNFRGCGPDEFCDIGLLTSGYDDVVIANGQVTDFAVGVVLIDSDDSMLRGLNVQHSQFSGIVLGSASRTQLLGSRIASNGLTTDQAGLVMFDTRHSLISHNALTANGDIGLYVASRIKDDTITSNVIARNPEAGMIVDSARSRITANSLSHNGDGIVFAGPHNVVAGNTISDSQRCGDGCGIGISFEGGSGNEILGNLVFDPQDLGIRVGGEGGNSAVGNLVRGAGGDAYVISTDAPGPLEPTYIRRNLAINSGDDGFDIDMHSAFVSGNIAVHNADLGFFATPGVHDGGGNHAAGNGDPRQCVNIACGPTPAANR